MEVTEFQFGSELQQNHRQSLENKGEDISFIEEGMELGRVL